MSIGDAVFKLRLELGLTQVEFADKLGVSSMSVSRWEAGKNDPPGECIGKLANMAGTANGYWYFLKQIGLTKKDFKGRL